MTKGIFLRKLEEAEYRAFCSGCRDSVSPEQIPYFAERCAKCWTYDQGLVFWTTYFTDVFLRSRLEDNFRITTRSQSGRALETIERVLRRLEPFERRQEVYKGICHGIKHAAKNTVSLARQRPVLIEWQREMLTEAAKLYDRPLKPKRQLREVPPVKKLKPKPGQLSLFEGGQPCD